jgi:hypothetical protein
MKKLICRLVLSMLMVFLITGGTTTISVLDDFVGPEEWNGYYDKNALADIGSHITTGMRGRPFTVKYLGLCIKDDFHSMVPFRF